MSRLERFLAKPKTYTIGGEELELKPLKVKNLDLITKMQNKDSQGETMQELIRLTLKESIPDATNEEIDNLGLDFGMELIEAIIDINGLSKEVDKKKVDESA